MRYFSCDSHVVEAAEIYDGLTDKFGDRAPFIEKDYQGKPGTWLVLPGGMQSEFGDPLPETLARSVGVEPLTALDPGAIGVATLNMCWKLPLVSNT